jgi:hypothetical protein
VFVAVAFLAGVQLVAIGILGAYVVRIFDEVKARPVSARLAARRGVRGAARHAPRPRGPARGAAR